MTATFDLLDTEGNVLRTVRGAGTAVMLRNAGECADFRAAWRVVQTEPSPPSELNEMFAMGDGVLDTTNTVVGINIDGEMQPVELVTEQSITAYDGVSLAALRKMASQGGMRAATGVDPDKQATRQQLVDFLNRAGA